MKTATWILTLPILATTAIMTPAIAQDSDTNITVGAGVDGEDGSTQGDMNNTDDGTVVTEETQAEVDIGAGTDGNEGSTGADADAEMEVEAEAETTESPVTECPIGDETCEAAED